MNIKALKEKRSKVLAEAKEMLKKCETEVRALTSEEDGVYAAKMAEADSLQKTIELMEARAKEDCTIIEKTEEKREADTIEAKEKRALENFIIRNSSEEARGMTTSTGAAVIPTTIYNEILQKLFEVAPLFSKARRFTPVEGTLEILKEKTLGAVGFVGENESLKSSDFSFDKVELKQKRAGSAIELTQQLINDSGIDIVSYSKNILAGRLGRALDRCVLNGDPSNKQFNGLLNAPESTYVETATKETTTIDDYLDTFNNMDTSLISGCLWVVGRKEFNHLAKLKDGEGRYYLIPDVVNGAAMYKLLGLPVYVADAMPERKGEAGEKIAVLVNMSAAYAVMIKKGAELKHISGDTTQSLKGSVLLLLDMYADGNIINDDAIRILTVKKDQ